MDPLGELTALRLLASFKGWGSQEGGGKDREGKRKQRALAGREEGRTPTILRRNCTLAVAALC